MVRIDFSPWHDIGQELAGTGGISPNLAGSGPLEPGSAGSLLLSNALPNAASWLVVGLASLAAPFKGGVLVPEPLFPLAIATDGSGVVLLSWTAWPSGVPAGTSLWFHAWIADSGGPAGFAASNALQAVTP